MKHVRYPYSQEFYVAKQPSKFSVGYFFSSIVRADGSSVQEAMKRIIVDKLLDLAHQGVLQIELGRVVDDLCTNYNSSPAVLESWLLKEAKNGLCLVNERSFEPPHVVRFVSLRLKGVTVQSLVWVLLSIKNDRMQPADVLVHSRFKEFFQIKVSVKDWKIFVEELVSSPALLAKMNKYQHILGEIDISHSPDVGTLFLLRNDTWDYEDLLNIEADDPDYIELTQFLDDFFLESEHPDELEPLVPPHRDSPLHSFSHHHELKKQSIFSSGSFYSEINKGKEKVMRKAIPGGKYGCALLVKNHGSERLKKLSLGRIHALIKLALHNQLIVHHRTLIIKNQKSAEAKSSERKVLIDKIKATILKILKENADKGVTLAQLPFLLSRKLGHHQNFQELGFPKLKHFLTTIEDQIVLEKSHNNHIKVYLRSAQPSDDSKQFIRVSDCRSDALDFSRSETCSINAPPPLDKKPPSATLKPNPFDSQYQLYNSKFSASHAKSFSTVQQYKEKLRFRLLDILNQNSQGIELGKLEQKLSPYMHRGFTHDQGYKDFQDFLLVNFDDLVLITIAKRRREPGSVYMVTPKKFQIPVGGFLEPRPHFHHHPHVEYGFHQERVPPTNYQSDSSDSSLLRQFPSPQLSMFKEPKTDVNPSNEVGGFAWQIISHISSHPNSLFEDPEEEDIPYMEAEDGKGGPAKDNYDLINKLLEDDD